jgi:hypothetical protein
MSTNTSRRAVKRLIESIKHLRGLTRLVNSPVRPHGTGYHPDAAKRAAQETHDRTWETVPDKAMVAYFANPNSPDDTRRSRS